MAGPETAVIDASVVANWFVNEPDTEASIRLRSAHLEGRVRLVASSLLVHEVTNALRYHPRMGSTALAGHVGDLFAIEIGFDPPSEHSMAESARVAFCAGVPIYDAAYIALAERLDCLLYSADDAQIAAAGPRALHVRDGSWAVPRTRLRSLISIPQGSSPGSESRWPVYALGHLGMGLGVAWLLAWATGWRLDYRFVLLGTMLPDIIDKPLGWALGLESRLWAHTLVFLVTVLLAARLRSGVGLGSLGLGIGTHLLFDEIWRMPWVVLWPAFGFAFPPDGDLTFFGLLEVLWSNPVVLAGEILGSSVLIAFAITHGITSWSALRSFVRTGAFGRPTRAS